MEITLQNWQQIELSNRESFLLSILAGIHAVMNRLINNLKTMATKYLLEDIQNNGNGQVYSVGFFWDNVGFTFLEQFAVPFNVFNYANVAAWKADVYAAILAEAVTQGYSGFSSSDIIDLFPTASTSLKSAPQAAIADCPADATTNYNTITTLLGAVTGAVNTANTKQNQIATQLNSLLAELRTLGLITP